MRSILTDGIRLNESSKKPRVSSIKVDGRIYVDASDVVAALLANGDARMAKLFEEALREVQDDD